MTIWSKRTRHHLCLMRILLCDQGAAGIASGTCLARTIEYFSRFIVTDWATVRATGGVGHDPEGLLGKWGPPS